MTTILFGGSRWLIGPRRLHYLPEPTHGLVIVESEDGAPDRWLTACQHGPFVKSTMEPLLDDTGYPTTDQLQPPCFLCWRRFITGTHR